MSLNSTPAALQTLERILVLARQSRPAVEKHPRIYHERGRRFLFEIDTTKDDGWVCGEVFVSHRDTDGRGCWAWSDTFGIDPEGVVIVGPELFRRGSGQYLGRAVR